MLDARISQLYFCQSLHTCTLQRGLTAIADLLVINNIRYGKSFKQLALTE